MRMRTINEASAYFTEQDPGTALTKTAIRRLVVSGVIPSVKIGAKYLVSIESIETYLSAGKLSCQEKPASTSGLIRKVEV